MPEIININSNDQSSGFLSAGQIQGLIKVIEFKDPKGISSDLLRDCYDTILNANRHLQAFLEVQAPGARPLPSIEGYYESTFTLKERNPGHEALGARGHKGIPADLKQAVQQQLGAMLRVYTANAMQVFKEEVVLSKQLQSRFVSLMDQTKKHIEGTMDLGKGDTLAFVADMSRLGKSAGKLAPSASIGSRSPSRPSSPSSDFTPNSR